MRGSSRDVYMKLNVDVDLSIKHREHPASGCEHSIHFSCTGSETALVFARENLLTQKMSDDEFELRMAFKGRRIEV